MNSVTFSLWQTEEKGNEELTLNELHALLHGRYEKFAYDKECIAKPGKVTYLYGKWEAKRGFVVQLRKLYHACCPSTYLQFHTKRSGSAHYGNRTKVFQLTDVSIFLSLLSHGYTLFSALNIDIVNNYADTPIP